MNGTRRMRCVAGLLAAIALPAAPAPAETWTNAAGHALEATPVALDGANVTLLLPSGVERRMPLHSFLPEEQQRLKEFLGVLEIPAPLRSAFRLAEAQLESARALRDDQAIDGEEYRLRKDTVLGTFKRECAAKSFAVDSDIVQRMLRKLDP